MLFTDAAPVSAELPFVFHCLQYRSRHMYCQKLLTINMTSSPVNLAFDLSLIAFYDFIFVSCLSCLEVCPNESLPKSDDRNMFKFAFEI